MVFSMLRVAGNATAMSIRERTTEMALFNAIGYDHVRILVMVLSELALVAGIGGAIGSLGCKGVCEVIDLPQFSAGFLPFFSIP
jgi:putative ABC transport system permease protein